jgi:hypothetical protein
VGDYNASSYDISALSDKCQDHLWTFGDKPVILSEAKDLGVRRIRSFVSLRMTAGHFSSVLTESLLSKCLTIFFGYAQFRRFPPKL